MAVKSTCHLLENERNWNRALGVFLSAEHPGSAIMLFGRHQKSGGIEILAAQLTS
jgi:hypothetical protein